MSRPCGAKMLFFGGKVICVLNQPEPTITFDFDSLTIPTELCVDMSDIKEEETAKAMPALKNNKVAGLDQIFVELLKHGGHSTVASLTDLMSNCCRDESVPEEWRKGTIVKLPKRVTLATAITVVVPGKVFCTIMLNRLRDAVDTVLQNEQAEFRRVQSRSLHSTISSSNVWNFGNHYF